MFKFLKSKKGFTLVELMIVVVIMAILVAVAVPIFSAVTKNARIKTCASNRREIVSQITNYAMSEGTNIDCKITIAAATGDDAGEKAGTITVAANTGTAAAGITDDVFTALFQETPYCPAEGEYVITCGEGIGEEAGSVTVDVTCDGGTDAGEHE